MIDDYPIRLNDAGTGGYPKNSNNKYIGPVTVSYAVQQSVNTVACRVLEMLGYATSFEFMENNLGFDLDERDIGVGPLAMGCLLYTSILQSLWGIDILQLPLRRLQQ